MKKYIFGLFLILCFMFTAEAQTDFIIRAGLHSVVNSESKINTSTVKGGNVGWNAGLDFRFGKFIYLQPGAHFYSSSLSLAAQGSTVNDFKNSVRLQSVKVPVVLGLSPFNLDRSDFAIVVNAGVVPTFNLGVKDSQGFIKSDDLTDVNWSGKVGAGLEIGAFVLGVDYEFGFNKLFKDASKNFSIIGATIGIKL